MKIFIGWDSREDIAYKVCENSIIRHASVGLEIYPIKQDVMRNKGIYWREHDPLSSTEFSFTRFLVPYLTGYKGWAVFMDCDFLWRGDIAALEDYMNPYYGAVVVKHDYKPKEAHKMDGRVQHQYPRKNWSSMILWNCEHLHIKALTPEIVNRESGMFLHQLRFLWDACIGDLPVAYNYLEGWHTKDDCPNPQAVHFTRGGPWFKDWTDVEYGKEWMNIAKEIVHE
jgi:hypothetical protein